MIASLLCGSVLSGVQPKQPDILFFLVDDLGWSDTSVAMDGKPNALNRRYRTPHLEKLARESVVYSNAYAAAPVCTPSRAAIMTGKPPAQTHVTYWTLDGDTSAKDPSTLPPPWQWTGLEAKDGPFLPELLRKAGYATILAGKAHFGAVGAFAADPRSLGFDVNIAGHAAGAPGSYYGSDGFKNADVRGTDRSSVWDVPGLGSYHGKDVFLDEALATEAIAAVRRTARGKPLFLYFAPYGVHTPIMPNKRYLHHYQGLPPTEAAYATMVETVDMALGDLIAELKAQKRWENTIVVFTSDNGGLSAHARGGTPNTHNLPLTSGKGSFYEGGIRVPLVVRVPGREPGRTDRALIGTDLYSMVAAWGKVPGATPRETPLFWHQPHFWGVQGPGIEPFSALRSGRYKLVYKHRDRAFRLFDLVADVAEAHNLSRQEPGRVKALAERLTAILKQSKAQMPTDRATGKPVAWPSEALKD